MERSRRRRESGSRRRRGRRRSRHRGAVGADAGEARLRELFRSVDTDGSGKISANELKEALSNGSWEPFNEHTVKLLIGMYDTNGDGEIDFEEFKPMWTYICEWEAVFRRVDRDGSGVIERAEMAAALRSFGYRLSDVFVRALLDRFDRQDAGGLYFDDFVEACVFLLVATDTFKPHDRRSTGVATYPYEDYLQDLLHIFSRFELL